MTPLALLLVGGCAPGDPLEQARRDWAAYHATPIGLTLHVVAGGEPVPGASVQLGDRRETTDAEGTVRFDDLQRHNAQVQVQAPGHYAAVRAVGLARPLPIAQVEATVVLEPAQEGVSRLLFGGDVMFGRRFVDVDGSTPRDRRYPERSDALVRQSRAYDGAMDVLSRIAPLLSSADITSVNFESPALTSPDTPHPVKDFLFYSAPETMRALRHSGVDFAALGNNHVYDYLDSGLAQTLDAVDAARLPAAGAGLDDVSAWQPWVVGSRGVDMAWFSATSIDGWRWDPQYSYVATPDKGGAANLQDAEAIDAAIGSALDAQLLPIIQVHTGDEYTHAPTPRVREHVQNAIDAGAALVIGHHPHTAQGLTDHDGVLVAWSLGNLAFDGLRLETLLGALVEVDFDGGWRGARMYPVYLEDFRPRMLTGAAASRAIRQFAEFSEGVVLAEEQGVGVALRPDAARYERRVIRVPVTVDGDVEPAIVDLRDHAAPDEYVSRISSDAPLLTVRLGRDLMGWSDFEDDDVDEDGFEVARWDHSHASVFPCLQARSGVGGLCSTREHLDLETSVIAFRQRIRVFGDAEGRPEKDLTLVGWRRGTSAGEVRVRVEFHASFGDLVFGQQDLGKLAGGTTDWERFQFSFRVPPDLAVTNNPSLNPRAVRLFLEHEVPRERAAGVAALDDLAMIGWADLAELLPIERGTPHPSDFVRVEGPEGSWELELELTRVSRVGAP